MIDAIFYTFDKRRNSTALPDSQSGTIVEVILKDDTSYLTPTLLIDTTLLNPTVTYGTWTYCKFNGRYYWITDIVSVNYRLIAISMTVDVLATYRATIFNYPAYIERCSDSSYYNTSLNDVYMPMREVELNTYKSVGTDTSGYLSQSGTYLITVVGGNGNPTSFGTTTYKFTIANMTEVLDFLFNDDNFKDTFTDTLVKTFFNPFQYILNCVWVPIAYEKIPSTAGKFQFGWWSSSIDGQIVQSDGVRFSSTITIPTPSYTDFRFYNPNWTTCELYLPGIGRYTLPLDRVKPGQKVAITYAFSYSNGDVMCYLDAFNTYLSSNWATPIAISQNRPNLEGMIGGATQAGVGIATGDWFSAGVGVFRGLQSSLQPSPSTNGSAGSRRPLIEFFSSECKIYQKIANDFPLTEMGRPCYHTYQLGKLKGYVKCINASVIIAGAYESERNDVNNYLNGGVYIE